MMFPQDDGLMSKIGITLDTVNTAKHANGFSPFRPLDEEERAVLQQRTKAIYATFLQRVADGRDIPLERVKEIAQGRVYAGNRALGTTPKLSRRCSNSLRTSWGRTLPKASATPC
jgi:protease-4